MINQGQRNMDINYKIYEEYGETSDDDMHIAEQMILNQIRQEYSVKSIVERPNDSVAKDVFFLLLIAGVIVAGLITVRMVLIISDLCYLILCIFAGILFFLIFSKKIILTLILMYQKYAPESVRSSCRFEPCCSEYMKISINKYGVLKGFIKGINRVLRCHYPNGGIDEP